MIILWFRCHKCINHFWWASPTNIRPVIKKINVKVPTFDWQKKSQMETKIASKLTL